MRLTTVAIAGFGAVALVAVSTGTAFAGEIPGNGTPGPGAQQLDLLVLRAERHA